MKRAHLVCAFSKLAHILTTLLRCFVRIPALLLYHCSGKSMPIQSFGAPYTDVIDLPESVLMQVVSEYTKCSNQAFINCSVKHVLKLST